MNAWSRVALVLFLATSGCATSSRSFTAAPRATSHANGPALVRSAWQRHAATTLVDFGGVQGYPCRAFEFDALPAQDDPAWTEAPEALGFIEASRLCINAPDPVYSRGEFRYFRATLWVPPEATQLADVTVTVTGIDDSAEVYVINADHPRGVAASCGGNGTLSANVAQYLKAGEANTVVLAHADLNCGTTSLGTVEITSGGRAVGLAEGPAAQATGQ